VVIQPIRKAHAASIDLYYRSENCPEPTIAAREYPIRFFVDYDNDDYIDANYTSIVKKYILVWCHFKALFKYYKFYSKHFSIRPSLGGENGVEGKNIKIYEWHLKRHVLL